MTLHYGYIMAKFSFGWLGLLLVMISGGFGAVGFLPLAGVAPGGLKEFLIFTVGLSSVAAIAAAGVAEDLPEF